LSAHAFNMRSFVFLNEARVHILGIDENEIGAIAAIKSSISGTEAFLEEMRQIGVGYKKANHSSQNPMVKMALSLERAESNRLSIKKKIQIAYEALSNKRFERGNIPEYQRFCIVVDVRNELAHPKASVLNFTGSNMEPPKRERQLIRKIRSNGFSIDMGVHDWMAQVTNKKFALWSYQACLDVMRIVIEQIPYKNAIDSYKELYLLNLKDPEQWLETGR